MGGGAEDHKSSALFLHEQEEKKISKESGG